MCTEKRPRSPQSTRGPLTEKRSHVESCSRPLPTSRNPTLLILSPLPSLPLVTFRSRLCLWFVKNPSRFVGPLVFKRLGKNICLRSPLLNGGQANHVARHLYSVCTWITVVLCLLFTDMRETAGAKTSESTVDLNRLLHTKLPVYFSHMYHGSSRLYYTFKKL